jgi:transcriptional regulator with XRE-family HTH domain
MRRREFIPHPLLDTLIERFELRNDSALARFLGCAPSRISRIRSGDTPVGVGSILRIHETTGMPIAKIKILLGLRSQSSVDAVNKKAT